MRIILVMMVLLFALPAAAKKKDKHKPKHVLPGRWLEIKRLNPDSSVAAFSDTLFMTFQIRDTFTYRLRNGFVYRGKYILTTDDEDVEHLDFGTRAYTIARRRATDLVLVDNIGIHYFGIDTSAIEGQVELVKEDKIEPVTNIDQMIGHWTVYKRSVGNDGGGVDFESTIKSAYITGQGTSDKQGYLYCGNDPDNEPGYYIKGLGSDQSLECTGKNQRFIKVVKCQKGEMILEEGGVSYYFKQFK